MGTLRDVQYRLLAKLVKLRAYNHCNVDQASAFSLDSAMKNYHAQTSSTVSKCALPPLPFLRPQVNSDARFSAVR